MTSAFEAVGDMNELVRDTVARIVNRLGYPYREEGATRAVSRALEDLEWTYWGRLAISNIASAVVAGIPVPDLEKDTVRSFLSALYLRVTHPEAFGYGAVSAAAVPAIIEMAWHVKLVDYDPHLPKTSA